MFLNAGKKRIEIGKIIKQNLMICTCPKRLINLEKKGVIIILTPSIYNPKVNKDSKHINLYSKKTIREEVVNAGFHFEKYIKDSPRTILTHTSFEYFLMRQIYRFYKPSFLSQSAACVAVKL